MLDDLRRRFAWDRKDRGADLTAGLTTGIAAIPDSMASALLAGINPLVGLYTMIVATPVGALVTSSQVMHVSTTGALSLGVASSLYGVPDDQKLQAVFVLTLMIGLIQAGMGLLKMGFLVRFVPHAVMTGFLNGVAVLIVLSQLANFTGYRSPYGTPVARALDTALNVQSMVPAVLAVGFTFVLLLLVLERVERVSQWAMVLAMVGASGVAAARASCPSSGTSPTCPGRCPPSPCPASPSSWTSSSPPSRSASSGSCRGRE
jgi:SulP family sulfate permease